jgi:tellurite resistance protein
MSQNPVPPLSSQDALVAVMIATCVSDEHVRTVELVTIDRIVHHLPVFRGYDDARTRSVATMVFDLLEDESGLDALFGLVRDALPQRLYETAYALACDVAAADGKLAETELRLLEEIRHELDVPRLHAAAIERGARARHMTV